MGSSITPKIMDQVAAAGKEEKLPPGFRFHPTDEELITYYLTKRISEPNFSARAIADVDLNKCEPWDLPGKAKMGEKEWYFFSLRDRKYPTGVRTNRATNAGYWKTTGKDKEIFSCSTHGHGSDLVGMKKTLVFYKGRAPRGEKTNWVMHEYRLHSKPSSFRAGANKDEWVVCRVFAKSSGGKKYPSSQARAANHYTIDMGPAMMPSLNLHGDPLFHHFGIGRSHHGLTAAELGDLARFARGQPGHNLPIQPQLNFPGGGGGGGGFTLSGLNLNLGAQPQPAAMRPMPFLLPQQQLAAAEPDSSVLTNCILSSAAGGGFNVSGGSSQAAASGPRFHNVDNCLDLESYWPTY